MSSLLIQVAKSPEPSRSPRLIAALCPPSRSLTHCVEPGRVLLDDVDRPVGAAAVQDEVLEIGISLQQTERSVASRNRAWLNDGVTTLMRGQAPPSGIVARSDALASVHGQPVLPGGGGGSS